MLSPAITLLFLYAPSVDSTATRQIDAPCQVVEERAIQYLKDHNFYAARATDHSFFAIRKTLDDDIIIELGNRKGASTPSARPLSLNRFSIHKYALPRHLSPLKAYADFRLKGGLRLANAAEGSCKATLLFEISAYEWVWALAVIDDGYRSEFISNGTLERLYIEAIGDFFTKARH